MAWFKREKSGVEEDTSDQERRVKTEGLWLKCEKCTQIVWKKALEENFNCCPKCDFHFRLDARARIALLLDGEYQEHDANLVSTDPLKFEDSKKYSAKLIASRKSAEAADALISATGALDGRTVNICAMEFRFMGGSMGAVVGEKITRAVERSIQQRIPLIICSASGGARMQEGAISLMQLARISAALMKLDDAEIGRAHV